MQSKSDTGTLSAITMLIEPDIRVIIFVEVEILRGSFRSVIMDEII